MKIIACEDQIDLRTIVSQSKFLTRIAKRYKLRNDQAVCYTNKAFTRFRLVMRVGKALFMCIPEIDDSDKYSIYLKISEELARIAGIDSLIKFGELKREAKGKRERSRLWRKTHLGV
jgi:hypothetical protein